MSQLRARSALVSVLTAGLETGLLFVAAAFIAGPTLVVLRWIGGVVGAGANYTLNRFWAFDPSREADRAQVVRFAVTALSSVTVSTTVWAILCACTGAHPCVLHPLTMMGVWMVFTFPLLKRWVFPTPQPGA